MGGGGQKIAERKKLRILCLHGFRTSGSILQTQVGKWDKSVLERLDLFFPDAPFPAEGKSDVEGHFPPPYYEWFQFNPLFTEYRNMDECLSYIENYMIEHGPFDALLGFSQGAILSAALVGLQSLGMALTRVPPVQFVIIISGGKFKGVHISQVAYSAPIKCPSIHFLGEKDFLKKVGEDLVEAFVDPAVIRHPRGHTVPRLDEEGLKTMTSFLDRVEEHVHMNVGRAIKSETSVEKSEKSQLEEELIDASFF